VSQFSAKWLSLREPYDTAARNRGVLEALTSAFREQAAIVILDLASGTGSTLRALQGCLPARQEWTLVDKDADLLAQAAALARPPHTIVETKIVDLVHELESIPPDAFDVVTVSALLDLVSSEWLDRLIAWLSGPQLPLYAALTYDGRAVVQPADSLDVKVVAAFNAHQRGDKGFGPALGPAAGSALLARLQQCGYAITEGKSDWILGTNDTAIQEAVFLGWSAAAQEVMAAVDLDAWLARRRAHLAQGRSTLRIGHIDCFAHPIGMRWALKSQSSRISEPST
jgi:SAM-dependent methyltransferase